MMMGPDVFCGEDKSVISLPIKLKFSVMITFTNAGVVYYASCCLISIAESTEYA